MVPRGLKSSSLPPLQDPQEKPLKVLNKRRPYVFANAPSASTLRQTSICPPITEIPSTPRIASEERSMTKNLFLAFRMLFLMTALTGLLASSANAQYAGQFSWGNSNLNET